MRLGKWRNPAFKNPSFGPPPPLGGTCEFIGLSGSGKSIVAPIVQDELTARGWAPGAPEADFSTFRESSSRGWGNEITAHLLERHVSRLRSDGCRLPYLSEYVRHTASILSWSWDARGPSNHAYFLNESLLHHFGPEIAELLATSSERPKSLLPFPYDVSEILGKRRSVIMTTSPRLEVLQRLESRRGEKVHWDWASAYGDRLGEFLDKSEDRTLSLVGALERHGVRIITVEVQSNKADGSLISFMRNAVALIDEEMRGNPHH